MKKELLIAVSGFLLIHAPEVFANQQASDIAAISTSKTFTDFSSANPMLSFLGVDSSGIMSTCGLSQNSYSLKFMNAASAETHFKDQDCTVTATYNDSTYGNGCGITTNPGNSVTIDSSTLSCVSLNEVSPDQISCFIDGGASVNIYFTHVTGPTDILVQTERVDLTDTAGVTTHFTDTPVTIQMQSKSQLASANAQLDSKTSLQIKSSSIGVFSVDLTGTIAGFTVPAGASAQCLYLDGTITKAALSGSN